MDDLEELVATLGGASTPIGGKRDLWAMQHAWRVSFAPEHTTWSGALSESEWHIFSYGYARHRHGAAAVAAYEKQSHSGLILAVSLARGEALKCRFRRNPTYALLRGSWRGDLYIMCEEMRWTFVLTHEEQIGPFFAESVVSEA